MKFKFTETTLVDVLDFLDERSLRSCLLASRTVRDVLKYNLDRVNHPCLEIVQLRQVAPAEILCRCLPRYGKARDFVAENMVDAYNWLSPLIHNTRIRLFAMVNIVLCEQTALNLAKTLPCEVVHLSMIGVNLMFVTPASFKHLVCVPLRARNLNFSNMINAESGHFSSDLLQSDAFMEAERIDVDIRSFQPLTLPCTSIYEHSLLFWFFEGPRHYQRTMISNRLCLGPFFLSQIIERFRTETEPKPTQLVLCGRLVQCTESFRHLIRPINGRLGVCVRNEETAEELLILMLNSEDKVEIVRASLVGSGGRFRVRPAGQAVR